MEINSRLDYGLLRNPLFIAGFLLVSILPEVVLYCSGAGSGSLLGSCSQEVVNASFVQNSFLSSSMVFLAFESQRIGLRVLQLKTVPKNVYAWIKAHAVLVCISLITLIAFYIINVLTHWGSGNTIPSNILFQSETVFKVLLIVFLSYYTLTLYSEIKTKNLPLKKIVLAGEKSDKKIELASIHFFNKVDRKYFLNTPEYILPINLTLKELESKLPNQYFVRINRAAIVNINEIDSYNYWEHEKYILKLRSGIEFTVTRKRLNIVKQLLTKNKKYGFNS